MNLKETRYSKYALVQEMMETINIVRNFNSGETNDIAKRIKSAGKLLVTGEGSSRIFPAKNMIRKAKKLGVDLEIITEGSYQSSQYDLSKYSVFCASNSGRTKEVISFASKLGSMGHKDIFALTANEGTLLQEKCEKTFILKCGWEKAVAATKSVIEQALFYESILWNLNNDQDVIAKTELADKIEKALTLIIPQDVVEAAANAPTIYFSGFNDGVAEELTLKTNEITRKKSDYLEGTYAVHGIEEVLDKEDIIFVIDPIEEEFDKFQKVLVEGIGLKVVAISPKETPFTTIQVPDAGELKPFVFLCAGWNLLVEVGIFKNINLDKPEHARKVGNEFIV